MEATAREHAGGRRGSLRLGLSPGVHYLAPRVLAGLDPGVGVSARQDNTGLLAELVAGGELEVALGTGSPLSPAGRGFAALARRLGGGSR